jgi:hypothetical protein
MRNLSDVRTGQVPAGWKHSGCARQERSFFHEFFKHGVAPHANTDRAAREIIDSEAIARDNRIARLRSLRLQSEAAERAGRKGNPAPKARKKAG